MSLLPSSSFIRATMSASFSPSLDMLLAICWSSTTPQVLPEHTVGNPCIDVVSSLLRKKKENKKSNVDEPTTWRKKSKKEGSLSINNSKDTRIQTPKISPRQPIMVITEDDEEENQTFRQERNSPIWTIMPDEVH
ncbi:hypothetical protein HAX54_048444 [Datura stramonium]|uniref:Uncharacterized protein n=1 Tax=Datura stramonium TaxID=4076 RepID=A0ABS8RIW2_DATST|nr:hypothetical protein [Datura stramonium]